jgi:hypothetical protein
LRVVNKRVIADALTETIRENRYRSSKVFNPALVSL